MIAQIVELLQPRRIFEFGTFDGRTTFHLAANSPPQAEVFTLDVQSGEFNFGADETYLNRVSVGQHASAVKSKVRLLTGDSTSYDFSPFTGEIDLIFIDAGHSYGAVMNDSARALEMLAPGGTIIWHDYLTIDDVTRALVELNKRLSLVNLEGTSLVVWRSPA